MEKERKLQIIRAALKRFIRHGLNKTTLDEVARDLRIGKATLYHYFTSKEDLYYQTLRYEISQYISEIKTIFSAEGKEFTAKIDDYFLLKENLNSRYKLIYDLVVHVVTDSEFKQEKDIFIEMLVKEEKLLKELPVNSKDLSIEFHSSNFHGFGWSLLLIKNFQIEGKSIITRESLLKLMMNNI